MRDSLLLVNKLVNTVVGLNVKNFGAIGNGVADDTAAIQAAIDYASANGKKTVYFPSGSYACLNIACKANVSLLGKGATLIKNGGGDSTSVIQVNGAETATKSNLSGNSTAGATVINLTSATGFAVGDYVLIRDTTYKYTTTGRNQEFRRIQSINANAVTLDIATIGSYATASSAEMVKLISAHDITIDRLTIQIPIGISGGGINGDLAYNVTIQNCVVSGPYALPGIGFSRSAYVNVNNNTVRDGQVLATYGYGLLFGESSHNCVAQYNYTYNIRENILTNNARYCSFLHNTDEYCYDDSFNTHGSGCEHCVISYNTSRNSRGYGICVSQSTMLAIESYITVQGNTIINSAAESILCSASSSKKSNHIYVLDNIISGTGGASGNIPAISAKNLDTINITNNNINSGVNGTSDAIYMLSDSNVLINYNNINNTPNGYGVRWATCATIVMDHNTIANCAKNFKYVGTSTGVSITNNTTDINNNTFAGTETVTGNSWQ
jgi:hypothetical protein